MKIPGHKNMKVEALLSRVMEWVGENGELEEEKTDIDKILSQPVFNGVTPAQLFAHMMNPKNYKPARDIKYPVYEFLSDLTMTDNGITAVFKKGQRISARHFNTEKLKSIGAMFKEVGKG